MLVLPQREKEKVLKMAHDDPRSGGHVSFKRTYNKILQSFYMPKSEIKTYCATCDICQRCSPKRKNERGEYIIPEIDTEFGHTWVIDVMGPALPRLSRKYGNHTYVLIAVETATRWVELQPLPSLKAGALAAAIESNLIARFACRKIIYDMQSGLMSDLMQSTLKILRVNSTVAVAGFHTCAG